jgi:competence protein ComEA
MHRIVLFVFVVTFCSCSSRVEISTPTENTVLYAEAINVNTATAAELERLPYIGRTTAESIVAYRDANGPFRRPEHLMLIRGVSETRFIEIRHLIRTR